MFDMTEKSKGGKWDFIVLVIILTSKFMLLVYSNQTNTGWKISAYNIPNSALRRKQEEVTSDRWNWSFWA